MRSTESWQLQRSREIMSDIEKQDAELRHKCQEKLRNVTDTTEKLRLSVLSRGSGSIKGIGRVFHIMDDDGSRSINFEEFQKGLGDYGVKVSDKEAKEVFDHFDKDGGGSLDFNEFLIALRPPMSQSRVSIIMSAFNKMDRTGDGVITVADLKGVYNVKNHKKYQNGQWTEKQCLEEFLSSFEAPDTKDGKVTRNEFMNYYAAVSASVDDDAYFDLMMRNAWKL